MELLTTLEPDMNATTQITECPRCSAQGSINAFRHVANGRCFLCHGSKTLTVKVSAEQVQVNAAHADETARRFDWLATLAELSIAEVVAKFQALSFDRLFSIRQFSAPCGQDCKPGQRLAYWCACKVLDCWPNGAAYPMSWIDAD